MLTIKDKDEALSYIENATPEAKRIIAKQLSFFLPNYQFTPAFRAGFSDGRKKFYKVKDDIIVIPKGLVILLIKSFRAEGIEYIYEKTQYTDVIPSFEEFQEFITTLNIPFSPYDYQVLAAFESIKRYRQTNLMATGSGKSLTIYLLIRWFLKNNLKGCIIVPTVMLTTQLYNDFVDYGWSEVEQHVRLIGGENKIKTFDLPITLSTWQSTIRDSKSSEYCLEDLEIGSKLRGGTVTTKRLVSGIFKKITYDDGSVEIIKL